MSGLRIAMIGSRGVPATFGGIERHVEELGARLVDRGHEVVVYCRKGYGDGQAAEHRGMALRWLPTPGTKHLEAISHSALSTISALRLRPDVVHFHALGPGLVAPVPRALSRAHIVQTIHGLDDERAKWSRGAQSVLKLGQWMSARVPHTTIAVSRALESHYAARHGRRPVRISNGVSEPTRRPADAIRNRWGLEAGSYVLFVGRFVPEKAPDLLLRAYRQLPSDLRLVLAGGSSHTDEFVGELHRLGADDDRVTFTGYAYGDVLDELYSNAAAFVLPSHLEGMPLTLLEAASYGTPVVASDIGPHLEILGLDAPGHRVFSAGDEGSLIDALSRSLRDPGSEQRGAALLRRHVLRTYSWDRAAEALEHAYLTGESLPEEIVVTEEPVAIDPLGPRRVKEVHGT